MSRIAVANHAKLSWLLLRSALRRIAGRANGHPLFRWPFTPLKSDRLVIAPQDLRTADATRATEIYSGRFAFALSVPRANVWRTAAPRRSIPHEG